MTLLLPRPSALSLGLEQHGNTSDMLFGVREMLAYFSSHVALLSRRPPGDGYAAGIGFGKNRFIAVGDLLECGITDLGASGTRSGAKSACEPRRYVLKSGILNWQVAH
jgi:2-keto-4-pentenoate hydratase/2-oxohepta-3-ene-1,7-dioic acid hydratase in catechol pathway